MSQTISPTTKSLSPAQFGLLRVMQRLRHGRIPSLRVRDGLPDLAGGVAARRTVKVLGVNTPHPAADEEDFVLRREAAEFLRMLRELGDVDVDVADLVVVNGLPVSFVIDEVLGA